MKRKPIDLVSECSDINETVIKALERENSCDSMEAVTVLKCLREKLFKLESAINEEKKENDNV